MLRGPPDEHGQNCWPPYWQEPTHHMRRPSWRYRRSGVRSVLIVSVNTSLALPNLSSRKAQARGNYLCLEDQLPPPFSVLLIAVISEGPNHHNFVAFPERLI